jgi:hypothetical protein
MRTLTKLLRWGNTLQQEHLSKLADALCPEMAQEHQDDCPHNFSTQVSDDLIDVFLDCPIWASLLIDQIILDTKAG